MAAVNWLRSCFRRSGDAEEPAQTPNDPNELEDPMEAADELEDPTVTPDEPVQHDPATANQVELELSAEIEDGFIRYGEPTVLKPIPTSQTAQPHGLFEHVPDVALDWLDITQPGRPPRRVFGRLRAVSARGHGHRNSGDIRQDSYAFYAHQDYVAIAVADGIGSASSSHVGSALAARHAVRDIGLLELLRGVEPGTVPIQSLSGALAHEAAERGLKPADIATTLVLAVIPAEADEEDPTSVTVLKIGDSSAWRRTEDGWEECSGCNENGNDSGAPMSPATRALPEHHEAIVWREPFNAGDVLALASDGIGNIVDMNKEFARDLSALWQKSAPGLAELLRVLDAAVKSFDDDRTFVGYRFS